MLQRPTPGPWHSHSGAQGIVASMCSALSLPQLLLGTAPKLNADKTPLFSNVTPPCCSMFFLASSIFQKKGETEEDLK